MSKQDDSSPAFPSGEKYKVPGAVGAIDCSKAPMHEGMTLRDYFAAKAMQGMCASPGGKFPGQMSLQILAEGAYELADAMLEARKK